MTGSARARYLNYLGSECHVVVIGICVWCRLFNDDPTTSARFSHLDPRDRSHAPPCQSSARLACSRCVNGRPREEAFILQSAPCVPIPRVVIVGAGFGGLQCAKALRGEPVDVDARRPAELPPVHAAAVPGRELPAEPVGDHRAGAQGAPRRAERPLPPGRRRRRRLRATQRCASPTARRSTYDHVVLATGSTTNYYGNDAIAQRALGLKDLGEALQLRNHVLDCLERAAAATDADERRRLLTFCIVGGGPTGVEYAGALAELVRLVLPQRVSRSSRRRDVRIVLLEGGDRVLPTFRRRLSRVHAPRARAARRRRAHRHARRVGRRTRRRARTTAPSSRPRRSCGPRACSRRSSPHHPGVTRTEQQRIAVDDHLRILGVDARVRDRRRRGRARPRRPAAADALAARDAGGPLRRPPDPARRPRDAVPLLRQGHDGDDRAAGRGRPRSARSSSPGFIGWLAWLVVHLYYLIGFENRLRVLLRWGWYYVRLDRPVRSILRADPPRRVGRVGNRDRPVPLERVPHRSIARRTHGDRRDHERQPRRDGHRQRHRAASTSGPSGADRAGSSARCSSRPSADNPDIVFGKVDTEAQPELGAAFNVMSIPTLMIFREQVLVFSQPGALPAPALDGPDRAGARARHGGGARRDRQAAGRRPRIIAVR